MPLNHPATEKIPVIILSYSFQHYSLDLIGSPYYTCLTGINLYVFYFRMKAESGKKGLLLFNRKGHQVCVFGESGDLDMSGKSDNFIADLLLKACEDGDGNEHDGQAQSDSEDGYPDHRAGVMAPAAFYHPAGNEEIGIQAN